jgi:hypothetical protein
MNNIQELDKEIKSLEAQIEAMENKKWKLEDKKIAIERQNLKDKVKEFFKEGRVYIEWKSDYDIPYHCDLFTVHEFLVRSQSGFKVRSFRFYYSDGDVFTNIEKEYIADANLMDKLEADRIQTLESIGYDLDKIIEELVMNPDRAEEWFKANKPENVKW